MSTAPMNAPIITSVPMMRFIIHTPRTSKRALSLLTAYVIKSHQSIAPPKMEA